MAIEVRYHETRLVPDGRKTIVDLWAVEALAEIGLHTELRMRSGARLIVHDDYEFMVEAFGESVRVKQYLHSEQI